MNKKILTTIIASMMLATIVPAFALTSGVPTQANAQAGGSTPPLVLGKAEWITGTWDDDPSKPYLQVNPPLTYGATKTLQYVMVVKDADGIGDLQPNTPGDNIAFADVTHPDGSPKYQVAYDHMVSCYDNVGDLATWINYLKTADSKGLVAYLPGQNFDTLNASLSQCSAKLFYGTADLDYCQMCGQFTWRQTCTNCQNGWTVDNFCTGYKVDAYAYDKEGTKSSPLTNYFEYICQAGIDTDFNKLDFQTVRTQTHKWIEGDRVFDSLGVACDPASGQTGCVAPTFRNTGNMPLTGISITQDDMGFNYSGPSTAKNWNVQWDARIGEYNSNPTVTFDPFVPTTATGNVGLCGLDKISFSIYVKKMPTTGTHTGTVALAPVSETFPWFTAPTGTQCTLE